MELIGCIFKYISLFYTKLNINLLLNYTNKGFIVSC